MLNKSYFSVGRTLLVALLSIVFSSALPAALWNLKMQFLLLLIFVLSHLVSTEVDGDLCMYLPMGRAWNMFHCFRVLFLQPGSLVSVCVEHFTCKTRSICFNKVLMNSLILVDVQCSTALTLVQVHILYRSFSCLILKASLHIWLLEGVLRCKSL